MSPWPESLLDARPRRQPSPWWGRAGRRLRGAATSSTLALGAVVLGAGALGLWWLAGEKEGPAVDDDRLVMVARRELLDAVNATGRVEPLVRVVVMSRASGILEEILVEEGDRVQSGQVLAELDREQLLATHAQDQADLASARARVKAAQARLEETRVRLGDPELDYAEREDERLRQLIETGDVTERERDDARLALARVRFRLEQVRASLPVLEAAVLEAEADLASAQANLERSETALREATIRCPIDGVVLVRHKEVGDAVSSILTAGGNATQILTLGDLSEMHVEARVDEVDLGRIHEGMPSLVTVDAYRGQRFEGQVQRIAPSGTVDDNGIVTFEVVVSVEDPEGLLKPDMTADVKLVLGRRDGVLTLPQRALQPRPDGSWVVQKVQGQGEQRRLLPATVELGLSDGLLTEIVAGLQEGDQVMLPALSVAGRAGP